MSNSAHKTPLTQPAPNGEVNKTRNHKFRRRNAAKPAMFLLLLNHLHNTQPPLLHCFHNLYAVPAPPLKAQVSPA